MGKPTKAQIKYEVELEGGTMSESTLRFHSVIAEEHEASSEITKFPAQSGFNISNHAIKRNRKVSITGVVTNHLVVGAEEFHEYGGNNSRVMFTALKELVKQAIPCEVDTNYDSYSPVVFTRFKTKLMAGKTDIMEFTLSGEEVQLGLTINQTAPTLLSFTPLTGEQYDARVEELSKAGIEVPENAELSEAAWDPGKSCQVETTGTNGKTTITTYEAAQYDPSTNSWSQMMHTSDIDVAPPLAGTEVNWFSLLRDMPGLDDIPTSLDDVDLQAGASTTAYCLGASLTTLGVGIAADYISTAAGELRKTVYGAAYGIFGVNGETSLGQTLLSIGAECLVAGAMDSVADKEEESTDTAPVSGVPSVDDAIGGATSIGSDIASGVSSSSQPSVLTKISEPLTDTISSFGDLI